MGIDVGGQWLANRDLTETNIISTGVSTVLPIGTSAIIGSALEWRPLSIKNKFALVGYNKGLKTTAIDAAFTYGLGKQSQLIGNTLPTTNNKQVMFLYYTVVSHNTYWSYRFPKLINESLDSSENK